MTIYTKKGDRGDTGLYKKSRKRVMKNSLRIRAIGAIDELNSYLGIVISNSEDSQLTRVFREIQRDLLTVGSILSGSNLGFYATKVKKLEKEIDILEKKLPKLSNFIIPGGSKTAANLHFARTLARRAEREVVALYNQDASAKGRWSSGRKPQILIYLNRLSDGLFMFARKANFNKGLKEETWKSGR